MVFGFGKTETTKGCAAKEDAIQCDHSSTPGLLLGSPAGVFDYPSVAVYVRYGTRHMTSPTQCGSGMVYLLEYVYKCGYPNFNHQIP